MPNTSAISSAQLSGLSNNITALREAAERLDRHQPDPVQRAAEIERVSAATVKAVLSAAETAKETAQEATRQERSRQLLVWWTTGALAVLALVIVAGVVTFQQSQERVRNDVLVCFLRPGAITPQIAEACDAKFSPDDHSYRKTREQARKNLDIFQQLQQRIAELEQRAGVKPAPVPRLGKTRMRAY